MNSTLASLDGSIYDTLYVARMSRVGADAISPDAPIDIYDAAQSRARSLPASAVTLDEAISISEDAMAKNRSSL